MSGSPARLAAMNVEAVVTVGVKVLQLDQRSQMWAATARAYPVSINHRRGAQPVEGRILPEAGVNVRYGSGAVL